MAAATQLALGFHFLRQSAKPSANGPRLSSACLRGYFVQFSIRKSGMCVKSRSLFVTSVACCTSAMCSDPEIMIRDHFTAPCEIGFDSTEPLGNRRSERQEFHPCKESAVAAQILLDLRGAENAEVELAKRDQRNITA
ncbi:MAG: hypothetical protein WCA22_14235 [Candidatus Binatus sp.]